MSIYVFNLLSCQPGINTKFHGGGEYAKTVFYTFCEYTAGKASIDVLYDSRRYIDEWILDTCKKYSVRLHDCSSVNEELGKICAKEERVVYFDGNLTEVTASLELPSNVISVGTYHGPRWMELLPQKDEYLYQDQFVKKLKAIVKYCGRKLYNKKKKELFHDIFAKFDYLIGVSEHSTYAMQSLYPNLDMSKYKVFYSPQKHLSEECEAHAGDEALVAGKYVLILGANRSTKNVRRGIIAVDSLFTDGLLQGYSVAIVGRLSNTIKRKIKNINRFVFFDYVEDWKLENLYKYSDVFLYPTLNEGFGYPPLEAMRYNRTCVVAANTSLTGVFRDGVYYINPYDLGEMRTRVLQAADSKIETERIERNYNRIVTREADDLNALCEFFYNCGIE